MLSRVTAFIEGFPLDALLEADLSDLLSEVEELMKYEVSFLSSPDLSLFCTPAPLLPMLFLPTMPTPPFSPPHPIPFSPPRASPPHALFLLPRKSSCNWTTTSCQWRMRCRMYQRKTSVKGLGRRSVSSRCTSGGVVNTFQVYLDLARKIQEASAMVNDAAQCFGSSHELESKRVALQVMMWVWR